MTEIIHFALLSAQTLPNIIPLVDSDFQPNEIVFLVTPQERDSGRYENFLSILRPRGINVSRLDVDSAWDLDSLTDKLDDCVTRLKNKGYQLFLNATCGTKPMSIASFMVFYTHNLPVYYMNNNQLIWLYNQSDSNFPLTLNSQLTLQEFFKIHSVRLMETATNKIPPGRVDIGKNILSKRSREIDQAISEWNYISSKASNNSQLLSQLKQTNIQKNAAFEHLAYLFENEELVRIDGKNCYFSSEQNRFFINGGWLEELLHSEMNKMKSTLGISCVARSVNVEYQAANNVIAVKNELDLVFIIQNRLYILECKTADLAAKGQAGGTRADDAIYKLATISKKLGGIKTRSAIVSFHKIRTIDKQRASLSDISVCDDITINKFHSFIHSWILNGT